MRLTRSARKHGVAPDEIRRVLASPLRTVAQETERGPVELHIGLSARRDLLEVVVAIEDGAVEDGAVDSGLVVLHAMRLRPANYRHLAPPDGPGVPA